MKPAETANTRVLIVESKPELGALWQRHLERQSMTVFRAGGRHEAISFLSANPVDIIILDIVVDDGAALAVSDYANYRHPEANVIFVTNTSFFSDGSIFSLSSNARAYVPTNTPPEDLVAMVEHYGAPRRA